MGGTGERFIRAWDAGSPKAGVALVHGLAEHSGRYEHVGEAFARAGYSVRAVDIHGHGRSEGFPGKVSGVARWHDDTAAVLEAARDAASGRPIFLLGHSLGSLIAASFVASFEPRIDGLVLSGYAGLPGPALLEAMSDPDGPAIPPELVSRDPEIVKAYVEDPLVFHDRVPVECNAAAMDTASAPLMASPTTSTPSTNSSRAVSAERMDA